MNAFYKYFLLNYHCRIITCVYRKNSSKLEDDIKSGKENLFKRTEKLQQVREKKIKKLN